MKTILILHENEPAGKTHFNMNGLPQRLLLKQRLKQPGYGVFKLRWQVSKETVVKCRWGENQDNFIFIDWVDNMNWPL